MRVIQAVAVILTALALVPSGAHLAEMSTKLTLDREQYFVVQQIYCGWALFGAVLFAGFFVNLVMAVLLWRRRQRFILPAIACLAIAASLITFFNPDSSDRLDRQDRRLRKCWANCRFLLSPVGSVGTPPPDPS
jgi:hypothetical protein